MRKSIFTLALAIVSSIIFSSASFSAEINNQTGKMVWCEVTYIESIYGKRKTLKTEISKEDSLEINGGVEKVTEVCTGLEFFISEKVNGTNGSVILTEPGHSWDSLSSAIAALQVLSGLNITTDDCDIHRMMRDGRVDMTDVIQILRKLASEGTDI